MKNGFFVYMLIVAIVLAGCSADRSPDVPSEGTIIAGANAAHDGGTAGQGTAGNSSNTGTGSPGKQAHGTGGNGPVIGTGGAPAVDAGVANNGGTGGVSVPVDAGVDTGDDDDDDDDLAPDAAVTDAGSGSDDHESDDDE